MTNFTRFFKTDGRHFQIVFLTTFLLYGLLFLGWYADAWKYLVLMGTSLFTQWLIIQRQGQDLSGLKSALITSLSLSILFYAGSYLVYALAAALAIGSKYLLRVRLPEGKYKHLFNPANFGIIAAILLTGQGWISPGQWGSAAVPVFFIAGMGAMVLLRVGRMDTGLVFLGVYLGAHFLVNILWRHWPADFFGHQAANGALWLFALFMITDPMTSPNHPQARVWWSALAALIAFYLAQFHFVNGAPLWVLFFMSPLSLLFDRLWQARKFEWQ